MKKMRVAIIGQGRSGRDIHGNFYLSEHNDLVEVVAVVDEIESRRERAKEEFKCDVYADYRELFKRDDIDLIVNATFSHLHYPIAKDCLEHGYNVLNEKPLARTSFEAMELEKIAKEKGLDVDVKTVTLKYSGRYIAENEHGYGILKVISDKKHKNILGLHMIGSYASEIIYGAAMMVETEMRVEDIQKLVFPHPTVCEVIRESMFM